MTRGWAQRMSRLLYFSIVVSRPSVSGACSRSESMSRSYPYTFSRYRHINFMELYIGSYCLSKGGHYPLRMQEANLARFARSEKHGLGSYSDALRATLRGMSRYFQRMCGRMM